MGSARLPRAFAWGKPPAHVRAWRRCSCLLCLVQVPVVFKRAFNARLHALRILGFIMRAFADGTLCWSYSS